MCKGFYLHSTDKSNYFSVKLLSGKLSKEEIKGLDENDNDKVFLDI